MTLQRFLLLALAAFLCRGQQQPRPEQKHPVERPELADVSIDVTTTFGRPVGSVLVVLKHGTDEAYRQVGTTVKFEKIPFGFYDCEIQAANFRILRERVGIFQPEVQLWFGLSLSPVEEMGLPEAEGKVVRHGGSSAGLWVRLVPLYGSDFLEARVGSGGEFHLSDLRPGRYVLLLFDRDRLILTRPVDVSGRKLELNLDVPH